MKNHKKLIRLCVQNDEYGDNNSDAVYLGELLATAIDYYHEMDLYDMEEDMEDVRNKLKLTEIWDSRFHDIYKKASDAYWPPYKGDEMHLPIAWQEYMMESPPRKSFMARIVKKMDDKKMLEHLIHHAEVKIEIMRYYRDNEENHRNYNICAEMVYKYLPSQKRKWKRWRNELKKGLSNII
jgi:hypothetical protein